MSTKQALTQESSEPPKSPAPKNGGGSSVPFGNPKKTKPTQVLPSDRLTTDKQLEALRGFVVACDAEGGAAVTNEQVGKIIAMSGQTVVVINAFFTDVGLLVRADSGKFTPGQAARDYQQAYDWDQNTAGTKLAPAFRDTWFAKALLPRLKMRSLTKTEAMAVLAEACKATPEYQWRLGMILEFLNAAGLLALAGDEVKAASGTSTVSTPSDPGTLGGGGDEPPKPPPLSTDEVIPQNAPFLYIDPEKKKKVILIAPDSAVTKKQFDRIKAWFDLQFFIEDEKGDGSAPNRETDESENGSDDDIPF